MIIFLSIKHEIIMLNNYVKITEELSISDLSAEEISAVFGEISGVSWFDSSKSSNHTVCYGNDVEIIYKAGERRVREVRVSRKYWSLKKSYILERVRKLIDPSGVQIYHKVVFGSRNKLNFSPFRWRNNFQLGWIPEGNTFLDDQSSLCPMLFQFKGPDTGDLYLDNVCSSKIFRRTFLPLIPLLKQYCETDLLYKDYTSIKKSWALVDIHDKNENKWVQLGYHLKSPIDNKEFYIDAKSPVRRLPDFCSNSNSLSTQLLSKGFSAYEALSDADQEIFLLGCDWFNKAHNAIDGTESFLFLVIMFEVFLPDDSDNCGSCGQPVFSVNKNFVSYVKDVIGDDWTNDLEFTLKKIYQLRSDVVHKGIFLAQSSIGLNPSDLRQGAQLDRLFNLARQFLVSWMYRQAKNNGNEKASSSTVE